jgi:hypothetical protein
MRLLWRIVFMTLFIGCIAVLANALAPPEWIHYLTYAITLWIAVGREMEGK